MLQCLARDALNDAADEVIDSMRDNVCHKAASSSCCPRLSAPSSQPFTPLPLHTHTRTHTYPHTHTIGHYSARHCLLQYPSGHVTSVQHVPTAECWVSRLSKVNLLIIVSVGRGDGRGKVRVAFVTAAKRPD